MGEPRFTLDQLLAYLEMGDARAEGFRSVREWAAELGASADRVREVVREGQARGVVRRRKEVREAIDGARRPVPVYAFALGDEGSHSDKVA